MTRHFADLKELSVDENKLGWEGVAAVTSSLTQLEALMIQGNPTIQGSIPLGRLPILSKLSAGTSKPMQETLE